MLITEQWLSGRASERGIRRSEDKDVIKAHPNISYILKRSSHRDLSLFEYFGLL